MGRLLRDNVNHDAALRLSDIGWIAFAQLKREDAKAPNVNLSIVSTLTLDQLWRHPAQSTDLAGSGRPLLSQLS